MSTEGVRIYNLFPLLVGTVEKWKDQIDRIAAMGFNWIFINPFHDVGASGSLYAVKDYYRLNPVFRGRSRKSTDDLLSGFVAAAEKQGLGVMMDLVINHTAIDSPIAEHHPTWFEREADGRLRSPFAIDPADIRKKTVWHDLAEIDFSDRSERTEITAYFSKVVAHYASLGFRGYRCDAAYQVPQPVWKALIDAARSETQETLFLAENLGALMEQVEALRDSGFDYLYNSAKWWDFEQGWLLEQYEKFSSIAPSIAFPETHDTERLVTELRAQGVNDRADIERAYRRAYLFSAAFSSGVMIPIGFEYGFAKKLHVVETTPTDWEEPAFDLTDFITAVNAMKASEPVLNEEGPQRQVQLRDGRVCCLLRRGETDDSRWALTVLNRDLRNQVEARIEGLDGNVNQGREITPGREGTTFTAGDPITLEPAEVRVFVND